MGAKCLITMRETFEPNVELLTMLNSSPEALCCNIGLLEKKTTIALSETSESNVDLLKMLIALFHNISLVGKIIRWQLENLWTGLWIDSKCLTHGTRPQYQYFGGKPSMILSEALETNEDLRNG